VPYILTGLNVQFLSLSLCYNHVVIIIVNYIDTYLSICYVNMCMLQMFGYQIKKIRKLINFKLFHLFIHNCIYMYINHILNMYINMIVQKSEKNKHALEGHDSGFYKLLI